MFGDVGPGCMVRWFEKSHSGTWLGKPAEFYELLEDAQPQLLDSMRDWGNLFIYHQEQQLFVLPADPVAIAEAHSLGACDPKDAVREVLDTATAPTLTREGVVLLRVLFPLRYLHFVDADGYPVNPGSCGHPLSRGQGKTECNWEDPYKRPFQHLAVITSTRRCVQDTRPCMQTARIGFFHAL